MKQFTFALLGYVGMVFSIQGATNERGSSSMSEPAQQTESATKARHWTGTIDITSNYTFLGISESNNLPAVQGSLTYIFPSSGIYVYLWGSNVKFADFKGKLATLEINPAIGFSNDIGENFNYDIYLSPYIYPNTAASYADVIGEFTYYFVNTKLGYSNDVFNYHGSGTYFRVGFEHQVPRKYLFGQENVNISGGVGRYFLPSSKGLPSYDYFDFQLDKTIGKFVLSLQWTGTNLQASDAPALQREKLVATITMNF